MELGRLSRQRSRAALQDMGQMRGARFDRYCIIEVVLVHLTADIHTRARARHFFAWASAPHLGRDGDGTGLACVFNFVPRLGTWVWREWCCL